MCEYVMLSEAVGVVETSPGKAPFVCYFVLQRLDCRRIEPFRGIGTRACTIRKQSDFRDWFPSVHRNDILRNDNKVFAYAPSSVTS